MRKGASRFLGTIVFLAALFSTHPASAAPVLFTVDTTAFSGTSASLAFDLIDGGPPANAVTVSGFTTDGTLAGAAVTGDVTGVLPGTVTLADAAFFNEYLQDLTLGTLLSFVLDDTGNPPDAGSFPDAFSFFLLDPFGLPLITTTDPTGANALFLLNMGTDTGLEIYAAPGVSVTAQPLVTPVPEPNALVLAIIGLASMALGPLYKKGRRGGRA